MDANAREAVAFFMGKVDDVFLPAELRTLLNEYLDHLKDKHPELSEFVLLGEHEQDERIRGRTNRATWPLRSRAATVFPLVSSFSLIERGGTFTVSSPPRECALGKSSLLSWGLCRKSTRSRAQRAERLQKMEKARTRCFRLICFLLGLVVPLVLMGCESLEFGYAKISDLLKNPSQYDGKEVKIKGKVIDVMKLPLFETRLYMVKDDTGEILVTTGTTTPGMGTEVRVKGVLDTMAIVAGKSIGLHLKESQRW